ncbi:MAG: helix-turn-helix domain-containing protein [Terracidiphilus sp.]
MPEFPLQKPVSPEPVRPADYSLLTADEVAVILRVPRSWIYSHLDLLPTVRLGRYVRFRRREIDRLAGEQGPC